MSVVIVDSRVLVSKRSHLRVDPDAQRSDRRLVAKVTRGGTPANAPVDRSARARPADAPVCACSAKVGEASLKGRNRRHVPGRAAAQPEGRARGCRRARRERRLGARDRGAGRAASPTRSPRAWSACSASSTASVCLRCERDVERIADVAMVAFARARPADLRGARAAARQVLPAHLAAARARDRGGAPGAHRAAGGPAAARPRAARRARPRTRAYVHMREIDGSRRAAGRHERARAHAALRRHRLARSRRCWR